MIVCDVLANDGTPPPSRVSRFNEDSFSLENFKSNGLTIALI